MRICHAFGNQGPEIKILGTDGKIYPVTKFSKKIALLFLGTGKAEENLYGAQHERSNYGVQGGTEKGC